MRLSPPETGFLGAPIETDPTRIGADVAVVGIPHGWPYARPGPTAGCALGPTAVRRRAARLARFRGHWDFDLGRPMLAPRDPPSLVDVGDVPGDPADGAANSAGTRAAISAVIACGAVPICIGGDDSVPIPVLRAFDDGGPLTVLQVDAHLDFRHEVDGLTEGYSSPMRRAAEMAHVERIVQVGLRGVGSARPADVEDARAAGNLLVTAAELRERGPSAVLEHLGADARIFVAFDCDGLDPSVLPAVSAPVPGGLSYAQADELLAGVGRRLVGAAVTEYVPALDPSGLSALVVTRLLIRLIAGLG